MTSDRYERILFIDLPGIAEPVPAGLFSLDVGGGVGSFQYGRRYLARPGAIALDPVNLPLSDREYLTTKNRGIFGILHDLLPDSWGRFVLSRQLNVPFGSLRDHELLDLVTDNAVGAIHLGRTPEAPETPKVEPVSLEGLAEIAQAFDRAERDRDLPPEVRFLLQQGTSLGGAQPKCPVRIDNEDWIAKFESSKTPIRFPAIEYATMNLAGRAGIRVPPLRLETLAGRQAFLIRRFDRQAGRRLPFLSAFAVSNLDLDEIDRGSYSDIAFQIRKFSVSVREDHHELFRRIAFNMMVRNEDDHLRNHGFILDAHGWRLSPAYDILPMPSRPKDSDVFHLALAIGQHGSVASNANLFSSCPAMSLDPDDAQEIVLEIAAVLSDWRETLAAAGVSDEEANAVRHSFTGLHPSLLS